MKKDIEVKVLIKKKEKYFDLDRLEEQEKQEIIHKYHKCFMKTIGFEIKN